MINFQHTIVESSDVDDHAACLSNWDQQYEQLSPGRFGGRLQELRLGPVQVYRETLQRAVLIRSATAPNTVTLGAVLGEHSQGSFCGRLVNGARLARLVPNREFELVTRGELDLVVIGVDADYLNHYSQRIDGTEFVCALEQHRILEGAPQDGTTLRDLLLATLAMTRESPGLLAHETLRRVLVQSLCDQLMVCSNQPEPRKLANDTTAATRLRVVREARQYMSNHADEAISVPDLCAAIHVSRRTLQYSFQDVLQMSPVPYLRALRLNGMRRALRCGGDEPVGDRAARWGFWHLSRFAADYRRMFGELPSQTLRRARATVKTS